LITLTDPKLGLSSRNARITTIEEDPTGLLKVEAEDWLAGVTTAIELSTQQSDGVEGFTWPNTPTIYPTSPSEALVSRHELAARNWTSRTIPAGTYTAVAGNGSTWTAIGAYTCATSPDGVAWTSRSFPVAGAEALAWNGSTFAAVGSGTTAATSPDGVTWTSRTIGTGSRFGMAWNGSVFAAVGDGGSCDTSPDGATWTPRTIPYATYHSVAWTGSLFVAVGDHICATSPDGTTWTSQTIPSGVYKYVAYSGTTLVAVGYGGVVASSPDGITWTAQSLPSLPGGTRNLMGVIWTGAIFVAVENSYNLNRSAVYTSADGATWEACDSVIPSTGATGWSAIGWMNRAAVLVGVNGAATSLAV
jgi:hypothetical protein